MESSELEKIKLMAIVNNDCIKESDAVVCLEGDGYNRINQTAKVYNQGLSKCIVVSGGLDNPPFCLPAELLAKKLYEKNIPKDKIIIEKNSQNTQEQGVGIMKMVKEKNWTKIILVASHYHQPRAYLTFLKAMKDAEIEIQIFNSPARELSWFSQTSWKGLSRLQMIEDEFNKIDEYTKKFHLISIEEAIKYQQWKETYG